MSRKIQRLFWAKKLSGWPSCIPRTVPKGFKALGKRYEKAVAKELGSQALHGCWWEFEDINGPGLCQTDFIIPGEAWAVILECKHTWTADGMDQLRDLYLPVVAAALDLNAMGVQVCKHLTPDHTGPVYQDLCAAVNAGRTGARLENDMRSRRRDRLVTLHWRGVGPMILKQETPHGHVFREKDPSGSRSDRSRRRDESVLRDG